METIDMFCDLPKTAPYSNKTTSKAAAKKIECRLNGKRKEVYDFIKASGERGATGSEVAKGAGILLYTAKPRCTELRDGGYIIDSGKTRPNDVGSQEIVWVLNFKPNGE